MPNWTTTTSRFWPILADSGWFSELEAIVSDILVWGGGGEVLIDSIDQIVNQLKGVYPKTEYIVQVSFSQTHWPRNRLLTLPVTAQCWP